MLATAHLTNLVFEIVLGGLAKRAGPRRENSTFSGLHSMSPREGGTVPPSLGLVLSSPKTYSGTTDLRTVGMKSGNSGFPS